MRSIAVMIVVAITLCCCVATGEQTEGGVLSGPPDTGRGQWLIRRLKTIADSGALLNANLVGNLLALDLKESQTEEIRQPPDCANPYSDSSHLTSRYIPQGAMWFTATPEGIPHMVRPGFAINRPATMGDPTFEYKITKIKSCTGRHELKEYTKAKLDFVYASGFACITASDLQKSLPEAKYSPATDGAMPFYYDGKTDDFSATRVEFFFFTGSPCMLSATVEQSQKTGKRYARALSHFLKCTKEADHEFCQNSKPFGWGDGDMQELMAEHAIEKCGTFDSYYQREPLSEEAPEPLPPRNYPRSPCDGK